METKSFLKKAGIGILIYVGVIVALILLAIVIVDQNPELNEDQSSQNSSLYDGGSVGSGSGIAVPEYAPRLGEDSAPVTIVEFGDFQCPFCKESYPKIRQLMNEFPGQIQFVYRHFPLTTIHPLARDLAHASFCAQEQEKFWPFHDRLFQYQESLTADNITEQARAVGLNTDRFQACQASGKWYDEVDRDLADAVAYGGRGTPTWLVNGKLYQGDIPSTIWSQIISQALE